MPKNLLCLDLKELEEFISKFKEPSYKAKQIFNWFYERYERDFSKMTNLKKELREKLKSEAGEQIPKILRIQKSKMDGSEKFLYELEDGERVETVKMPMEKNYTFCLSTQTGCPLRCIFCLTGQRTGRNLKPYEIFGTFLGMAKGMEAKRINVVFMGMGEPLLNLENLKKVLPFFYISIAPRRITISTAGILDKIKELGKISPHPRLAISLNAGRDKTRKELMPFVNYKINELIEEIKNYPKRTGEKVTIEYVLLKDINDTFDEIKALSETLSPVKKLIKINFIPFNQVPELQFFPPEERKINEILEYLSKKGFHITVRRSKGRDISAACGQLKAEYSENI